MINRSISTSILLACALICGCSDASRPHREALAICIIKSSAPLDLDFDSIPSEMHRMHMGAERSKRTADLLDEFLTTSPPLDSDIIALVETYAASQRTLSKQFASAVADGRTDLTTEESEIAAECARQEFFLTDEICKRIDFDSLVTVSQ